MKHVLVSVLGGWLVLSCGGNVEHDREREPPDQDPQSAENGSEGADGPQSSADFGDGMTALGECVPGPQAAESFDQPCAWIAKDRCYAEREMACNCACPRSGDSLCTSGFEAGEDGRVWVSCQ